MIVLSGLLTCVLRTPSAAGGGVGRREAKAGAGEFMREEAGTMSAESEAASLPVHAGHLRALVARPRGRTHARTHPQIPAGAPPTRCGGAPPTRPPALCGLARCRQSAPTGRAAAGCCARPPGAAGPSGRRARARRARGSRTSRSCGCVGVWWRGGGEGKEGWVRAGGGEGSEHGERGDPSLLFRSRLLTKPSSQPPSPLTCRAPASSRTHSSAAAPARPSRAPSSWRQRAVG